MGRGSTVATVCEVYINADYGALKQRLVGLSACCVMVVKALHYSELQLFLLQNVVVKLAVGLQLQGLQREYI